MYILIIILISISALSLLLINNGVSQNLPIAISLVALTISLISAFKNTIFPFKLRVISESVVIVAPSEVTSGDVSFIFPMYLINEGYGESVISYLFATIENGNNREIRVIPLAEVPVQKFITNKGRLDTGTITSGFWGFPMREKHVLEKSILMGLPEKDSTALSFISKPGSYKFSISVKIDNKSPKKIVSFSRELSESDINKLKSGFGVMLMAEDPLNEKNIA